METHTHISYDGCYWNFVDWFFYCDCDLDGSNENCCGLGVCATSWRGVYTKVSRHCAIHCYLQSWLLLLNYKHCQELLSQAFVPVIFCLNQSPRLFVVERCLDKLRELQGSVEANCNNCVMNTLLENIDKGLLTGVIFLDLSKAFDTCIIMLDKLNSLGMNPSAVQRFWCYLTMRTQSVCTNGVSSEPRPISSGVPPG